jgi:hypothetical protein
MITAEALRTVLPEAPTREHSSVPTTEFILVPNEIVPLVPQVSPLSNESLAREYQSAGSAMFNLMHGGLFGTSVSLPDLVRKTVGYKEELKRRGIPKPHLNLVAGPKRIVLEDGHLSFEYPNQFSQEKSKTT